MVLAIDDVFATLPALGRKELEQIKARASFLLMGSKDSRITDKDTTLLYSLVDKKLRGLGIQSSPFWTFKRSRYHAQYDKGVTIVDDFIKVSIGSVGRPKRCKLYGIFVNLIIDDLTERGVELKAGIVIANLQRVPALVEKAFPGYVNAGLAHMILSGGKRGR